MTADQCAMCGRPVARRIPDGLDERWRELAESMRLICDGCATREQEAAERADRDRERAQHARTVRHRLAVSGIPARLRSARFDHLDGDQPADDARRWAAGELPGLLLSGPVGAGKTYTAAAAAVTALDHRPVIWCSVPALLAQLGADRRDQRHEQALDVLLGSHALVLDDLDKARPTDYGAERIFAAVDGRAAAGRQLLVTTNLELDEIAARYPQPYGEGIASRLVERCAWHRLERADRRMDAAALLSDGGGGRS